MSVMDKNTEEETALVRGDVSAYRRIATGVAGLGVIAYILGWGTLFQRIGPDTSLFGFGIFDFLGVILILMGVGILIFGLSSRQGVIETTPSHTSGLITGIIFGLIGFIAGGLIGSQTFGLGTVGWISVSIFLGSVTLGATILPREDIGSTIPTSILLIGVGYTRIGGIIGESWKWNPGKGIEVVFTPDFVIPLLTVFCAVLGVWAAGKARKGFGSQGRQEGAFLLISMNAFTMIAVLVFLVIFIVEKGHGALLENLKIGAIPGLAVVSIIGAVIQRRTEIDFDIQKRRDLVLQSLSVFALVVLGISGVVFLSVLVTGNELSAYGATIVPELTFDWPFTMNPSQGLRIQRGVMPAILGTVWLVVGAVLFSVPLGVGAAVFLTEYAEQGWFTGVVETATNGLWSTPSVVYGLFGLAFIVPRFENHSSIFAGQLVLGFMLLPLVMITSREAMKSVPDEYRDASAALGVSKWQTIKSVVLPASMPGIITGVILGVGRIAGETAPLLLVMGGQPFPGSGPNVLSSFELSLSPPFVTNDALLQSASALPYQLYSVITAGVGGNQEFGWGTALVLLMVVLSFYAIGIVSRIYFRRKLHRHE